jgi:2-polyprenyl-3-methyl-5-hydroxy-6-metoxy-1,4-benzoquinol methylase
MLKRTKCPISNLEATPIFERSYASTIKELIPTNLYEPLSDKVYQIQYCKESGLYFQTWILEDSELHHLYHTASTDHFFNKEIANQKLHSFAHQTEEILVFRQLCLEKIPKVLDFGCSWGKWGSMALAHGCEVYGFDVDATAIEFCSKRGIKMLSLEEIKKMKFDFINCDQVLEHVANPLELTRSLAGALKNQGFLKISTPQDYHLPSLLIKMEKTQDNNYLDGKTLDALYPLIHVNLFSRKCLENLANRVNLKPVKLPLMKWLGAGQLWNIPRQLNRNLRTPFKRWLGKDTYLWFQHK